MTNYIALNHKIYVGYFLCYDNSNSIMKVISYLGQLSLMLGNGFMKVLHDLNLFNLIFILCMFVVAD